MKLKIALLHIFMLLFLSGITSAKTFHFYPYNYSSMVDLVAVPDINQIPSGISVSGNVLTNDFGTGLSVVSGSYLDENGLPQPFIFDAPTLIFSENGSIAGTFTFSTNGAYIFASSPNFTGKLIVRYTVEDELSEADETTLTIEVLHPIISDQNNPPVANDDTAFTIENTRVNGTVLGNDSDTDGDPLRIMEIALRDSSGNPNEVVVPYPGNTAWVDAYGEDPSNPGNYIKYGEFLMESNGEFQFVPEPGIIGQLPPINYTNTDNSSQSASAKLNIRILEDDGSNYTFANDDASIVSKGGTINGNVLDNDSDPNLSNPNDANSGDNQLVTSVNIEGVNYLVTGNTEITVEGKGIFTIAPDGTYSFVTLPNLLGTLVVEVQVCDEGTPQACDSSNLYLTSISDEYVCYENLVGNDFSWSYPSGTPSPVVEVIIQPGTNGGFVLDIFKLDNSFNMNINGIQLATQEIEFQQSGTDGQNIRFADGTIWEEGGILDIWELLGEPNKPIVRVVIDRFGDISMFGSKVSSSDPEYELYPLELFNGNSFNNIAWNYSTDNYIEVSQNVVGLTEMTGTGYGRNIIDCACYKPGVFIADAGLPSNAGISSLRITNSEGWPQVRNGTWLVLESKNKGFVPNRLTGTQLAAIPADELVAGMMVYNITEDCLQINVDGTALGWKCFHVQTCPDNF